MIAQSEQAKTIRQIHTQSCNAAIICKKIKQYASVVLLLFVYLLSFLFSFGATADEQAQIPAPNILFILTDDQRHTAVGYEGEEAVLTPNLDALAAQGIHFSGAHIMGALNAAVCAPSRAMLMTGRGLFDIIPSGEDIPAEHFTLPEWFKRHGYHTFHTGKWHNGKASFNRSFSSAKDIFFGGMSDQYEVPLHSFDPSGEYPFDARYFKQAHSTDIYADNAVDFLQHYKQAKPFFAFVSFQSPHDPKQVPKDYLTLYSPDSLNDISNLLPEHPFHNGELDVRDEWLSPMPRRQNEVKAHLAAYYAMISHIDDRVGDILSALNTSGFSENTIIVYSSDNGLALGQHGLLGKQSLYDHSVRVPLIITGPRLPKGQTIDDTVYLSSMFNSLTDMAGLPPALSSLYPSLLPLLKKQKLRAAHEPVFAYKSFQRALKLNDFKLIEYLVKDERHTQLFHLPSDPLETKNLAELNQYQSTLREMQKRLQIALKQANDPADLAQADWGVAAMEQWGERHRKPDRRQVYDHLKSMAEAEHEMVMGYFEPKPQQ